jgi:hypothetical protein
MLGFALLDVDATGRQGWASQVIKRPGSQRASYRGPLQVTVTPDEQRAIEARRRKPGYRLALSAEAKLPLEYATPDAASMPVPWSGRAFGEGSPTHASASR